MPTRLATSAQVVIFFTITDSKPDRSSQTYDNQSSFNVALVPSPLSAFLDTPGTRVGKLDKEATESLCYNIRIT